MPSIIQTIVIGLAAAVISTLRKYSPVKAWLGCLHNLLLNTVGNLTTEEWQQLAASNEPCGIPQCKCHENLGHTLEALKHLRNAADKMKAGKTDKGDAFIPAHLRG